MDKVDLTKRKLYQIRGSGTPPISFTVPGAPSTHTSQQKGVHIARKRAIFYTKSAVKAEHRRIRTAAWPHRPEKPIEGPVDVSIELYFPLTEAQAKAHVASLADDSFAIRKITKPDADNSAKLIVDVLTDCGFFKDDAQVADLHVSKYHGAVPRIEISILPLGLLP
jgi:Holliday junction resolvase RusA-like endonuclease